MSAPDSDPANIDPLKGHALENDGGGTNALIGFCFIERALLMVAAAMTIGAAGIEIVGSTALARLIVLQGKDMAPENILFEAGAILLLAIAAVVIVHAGKG